MATVSLVLAVSGARDGILALLLAGHAYELGPIVGWDVRTGVHGLGVGAGIASPMSSAWAGPGLGAGIASPGMGWGYGLWVLVVGGLG